MAESKLRELSTDFAVKIIKLCDDIKGHYSIVNQLERSATSIGANIREVHYAQSRDDFVSKLEIALKEANETDYWLELLVRTKYISEQQYRELCAQCAELRVLLVASCRTAKKKRES